MTKILSVILKLRPDNILKLRLENFYISSKASSECYVNNIFLKVFETRTSTKIEF